MPPPRKKLRLQGLSTGLPQQARHRNHVWCWDFVSDYTQRGGKLRCFNLIDEYTRECHCIHADRTLKAPDVLACLAEAIERQGAPQYIRSDNGPEFIAKAIQSWLKANQLRTLYIDPGCPWQNGYAESFNSRFRAECLDREVLRTLSEARVVTADWPKQPEQVSVLLLLKMLNNDPVLEGHVSVSIDEGSNKPHHWYC